MNIKVTQEDLMDKMSEPVGECALCSLDITVDKNLSTRVKQRLVIHAVIENSITAVDTTIIPAIADLI